MDEPLPPFRRWTRAARLQVGALLTLLTVTPLLGYGIVLAMPGTSHAGALPALTPAQTELRDREGADLAHLAGEIGERNTLHPEALTAAAAWIDAELRAAGYSPERQGFVASGVDCANVEAEHRGAGAPEEIVLVGAHYDSARGTPGANDDGTGIAALLALARSTAARATRRTVRFVAFVNEEPPYFASPRMGSALYAARSVARGEKISAMLSLEMLGAYDEREHSQHYPFPLGMFFPERGDFLAFVGNVDSRALVRSAVGSFRATTPFPAEGAALPAGTTAADWSDHRSFWAQGYPALMVTDTAIFRYAHYHRRSDTPDKVDVDRLARVTEGLDHVVAALAD
jgi:Peptidase family M28